MRAFACLVRLSAAWLRAQPSIPSIDGETLPGKKVSLPAASAGQPVLLIIGFTHASQAQTKAWGLRVHDRPPGLVDRGSGRRASPGTRHGHARDQG
jgi:hypothetical protein